VLATPDVGMSEIVRESGAGRVVDASPASIGAALEDMVTNHAACRAMGEAGRAHVIAHYGWESIARRMAELYEVVVANRRKDRRLP
jgi:glycosyltransferase involved in cell wall biosynthesis